MSGETREESLAELSAQCDPAFVAKVEALQARRILGDEPSWEEVQRLASQARTAGREDRDWVWDSAEERAENARRHAESCRRVNHPKSATARRRDCNEIRRRGDLLRVASWMGGRHPL